MGSGCGRRAATVATVEAGLVVLGDLVEDVVVWLSGPAERGTDTAARIFRSRGGSAANVAVAAALLTPTRFVGRVGADPLGDRLVAELVAAGVEVRAQRGGRTGSVVVLVEPGGERTMLPDRAAAADLAPLDPADLAGAALVHVPAYGLDGGRTAAVLADLLADSAAPARLSLDASSVAVLDRLGPERFRALVERTRPHLLFANADEARVLGLQERRLEGVTVLVKDGARPTTVCHADGRTDRVAVPPVDLVRDSTGAGDAFAAGVLAALLQGQDLHAGVVQGHALAREVLSSPGATTAGPGQ